MEKIVVILWNIWTHKNQVVFRKIKPNQFFIIEKAILTFQNLHKLMSNLFPSNKGHDIPRRVEKWIIWIPQINGIFKLNFDGSRINNISASGWVIRDSNGIINVVGSRHLGKASIIITKCVALRDGVLAVTHNGFTSLEIEGDSKVIIDCYNKTSSPPSLITLLMQNIWRLSHDLNVYNCCHNYK